VRYDAAAFLGGLFQPAIDDGGSHLHHLVPPPLCSPAPVDEGAPADGILVEDEAEAFSERLAIATIDGRLTEEEALSLAWAQIHARRRAEASPSVADDRTT
jgi:hypothetical protein